MQKSVENLNNGQLCGFGDHMVDHHGFHRNTFCRFQTLITFSRAAFVAELSSVVKLEYLINMSPKTHFYRKFEFSEMEAGNETFTQFCRVNLRLGVSVI